MEWRKEAGWCFLIDQMQAMQAHANLCLVKKFLNNKKESWQILAKFQKKAVYF